MKIRRRKRKRPRLPPLPGRLRSALELLPVCEEEMGAAGNPPGVFAALWPTAPVRASERLYRAHVRELLRRAAAGEDLAPATEAEILGTLSRWSLRAPPGRELAAVFEASFRALFPEEVPEGPPATEAWPGQVAEERARLRHRLRVPDRKKNEIGG